MFSPLRSRFVWLMLVLLFSSRPAAAQRDAAAVVLLEAARDATRAATSVRYEFEYEGAGISAGRFSGRARLQQVTDADDSRWWAETTMQARPAGYDGVPARFALADDGARVSFLDRTRQIVTTASSGDGARHLTRHSVFLVLFEFVKSAPFDLELRHARDIVIDGTSVVAGVLCDVVRVVYPPEAPLGEVIWYFGRADHLPRKQVVVNTVEGRVSYFSFTMSNLQTGAPVSPGDFRVDATAATERLDSDARSIAVGAKAPDWTLAGPDGAPVSMRDLRGRVVVLDFWVTWCPYCKVLMPGLQAIHDEFRSQGVSVFGVNVWESGDPIAHMKSRGLTYGLLLNGEPVGDVFKVQWQPAVVVIGRDGIIRHLDYGGGDDRNARPREAVKRAAAQ